MTVMVNRCDRGPYCGSTAVPECTAFSKVQFFDMEAAIRAPRQWGEMPLRD